MYWDCVYFSREESLAPNGDHVVPPGYYVLGYANPDDDYPAEAYSVSAVETDTGLASESVARQIAERWNTLPNASA